MLHCRVRGRLRAMFLPSCDLLERFVTRWRHRQSTAILSALLLCGVVSCAKPPRGTASIVGIQNAIVNSPSQPSVRDRSKQAAPAPAQRKSGGVVSAAARPDPDTEGPRALGTSGASSGGSRPLHARQPATGAATTEPGAESTVGQAPVTPSREVAGGPDAMPDDRRIIRSLALPLSIMAILAAIVLSRRWW